MMQPISRKVIVYIAMSIDGFIAGNNDDLSFLSIVEQEGEDYGYKKFLERVDTILIGRRTFEKVLSFGQPLPYSQKKVYVVSTTLQENRDLIDGVSDNPVDLVSSLKSQYGLDIYCDGGAELIHTLLKNNLIDELIISVIPTLLGNGIRLFKENGPMCELQLLSVQPYEKGLVQLHYIKK
ncbi:MAG: dihydrofolate reductase family protein [Hydrotalea sp.]|nr:dihydrofolate reductase family protein [Hydrotalea sp.]